MTQKDPDRYRKLLEEAKQKLEREVKELGTPPEMGSDVDEFEEEGEEAEAFGAQLGMEAPLRERLRRVEEALRKIAGGVYGKCERCGRPIEETVLAAAPESEYCQSCKFAKREKEKLEKQ